MKTNINHKLFFLESKYIKTTAPTRLWSGVKEHPLKNPFKPSLFAVFCKIAQYEEFLLHNIFFFRSVSTGYTINPAVNPEIYAAIHFWVYVKVFYFNESNIPK